MKFVYLLEAATGEIKIGCSDDPWRRREAIDRSSPQPVRLIAKWGGSPEEERGLHARFRVLCIHREWYRNEGDLTAFVDDRRGLGLNVKPDYVIAAEMTTEGRKALRIARLSAAHKANWADPTYREMQTAFRARRKRRAA